MERTAAKIFLTLFLLTAAVWLSALSLKNYHAGELLTFGTVEFRPDVTLEKEQATYRSVAELSVVMFVSYPLVLLFAFLYLRTTVRTFKEHGWLLMSALLLFLFMPVEAYCFWLDWKLIGLQYWGTWPMEEFRKAFLARVTTMAGLPLIAQLCYLTIPVIIIVKPFKRAEA